MMEPGASKRGRWRNFSFQLDPLNDFAGSGKVTLQMASQYLGKSAILAGGIAFRIDCMPTSMLLVNPTESGSYNFMRSKLNPIISSTPSLSAIVSSVKTRKDLRSGEGGQRVLRKVFPNGFLLAGGSIRPLNYVETARS
jgi:phage terminase large subunit GpA-like protein